MRPTFAPGHHGRGLALAALGDAEAARQAHEQAAALDPAYPDPVGALAALAAEAKDLDAARAYAAKALGLDPHQSSAVLALATLEVAERAFVPALARLEDLLAGKGAAPLAPLHLASAYRLMADALDALDRPDEAMAAYAAANRELRQVYAPPGGSGVELGVEHCRRLLDYFHLAPPQDWGPATPAAAGPASGHAFLVGFPRSGTTLLEQVLASHDQVTALEEQPTLEPLIGDFFSDSAGLDRLAALKPEEAAELVAQYWARVRGFGVEPAGKLFIDKLPLNTIYLPLVAKLFPDAKIILAIRDPRDVVISCFRRRFRPNTMVIEYTDLERTALFYDGVMRLAQLYRQILPLPVHQHRHERLVEDFDAETQALCGFLGLTWSSGMRDFVETANRRDIRTPSAAQVRRGLYKDGMGQWRRYAKGLEPVAAILAPWVKTYGYPES